MNRRLARKFFLTGMVFVASVFLTSAVVAQSTSSAEPKKPSAVDLKKLEVPVPAYNFGTIMQGDQVTYRFVIRNHHDFPVKIEAVKATCGCTTSAPSTNMIPPQSSTEIEAKFNSEGREGEVESDVAVFFEGAEEPTLLKLRGQVMVPIAVTPSALNFGKFSAAEGKALEVTLKNNLKDAIKIQHVTKNNAGIKVEFASNDLPAGATLTLKVTAAAGQLKPGMLNDLISIWTNNSKHSIIPVFVSGEVVN